MLNNTDPIGLTESSKQSGAPRVVMSGGRLVVTQKKLVGWLLLAFGLGVPALILVPQKKFRQDPFAYLTGIIDGLGLGDTIMVFAGTVLLTCMALYGLFWLFWTRRLVVDLFSRKLQFQTGVWPFVTSIDTDVQKIETINLCRIVRFMKKPTEGGSTPIETWEISLVIPGVREPLYLGEWALRQEALNEVNWWKEIFPELTLDDKDLRQDIGREAK